MHFLLRLTNVACHQENVCARGEMRKKTALLDYVANPASQNVDVIGRNRFAVELDRAGVRLDQTNDQPEQS